MSCGISIPFEMLSPSDRQVTHALLTRPPLSFLLVTPKGSDDWLRSTCMC